MKFKGVNFPREFLDKLAIVARLQNKTIRGLIIDVVEKYVLKGGNEVVNVRCPSCGHEFETIVQLSEYSEVVEAIDKVIAKKDKEEVIVDIDIKGGKYVKC